ncbi:DUF6415 family natural product biosynthesis protein [Streptomyces sp. NPDC020996]|uniref:DUF6415 family natural product biosynthesis protein n=1 Tax=Streptomyces sp. NPDC020996 TaxID=3154791 RepID=UPI0033FF4EE7
MTAEREQRPPDVDVMRSVVRRLLAENADPLAAGELETVTLQLRGHINLMIPEVQAITDRLPKEHIPRYCALACLGEARRKVRLPVPEAPHASAAHARRLARVVAALCDHFEALGGEGQ